MHTARGMRARPERALLGYHGRVLVSTRVQERKSPLCGGPGADKSRFCGPGDRLPGRPRRWRVLLHDGICPSAVSIALSGVPARNNYTALCYTTLYYTTLYDYYNESILLLVLLSLSLVVVVVVVV